MSISHPKSVVLLGAGVSEPFGMPLGGQLIDLIADQIERETPDALGEDFAGRKGFDPQRVVNWVNAEHWHQHPIYGTAIRSVMQRGSLDHAAAINVHKEVQTLRQLLRNQTAETIDSFIAENPNSALLTKRLVAAMLLRASYDAPPAHSGRPLTLKNFSERVLKCNHRRSSSTLPLMERNWIHLLINLIRHAIDDQKIGPANKVKIITFNYDTILEHVLESQFANRESPLEPFGRYVKILHVHGQVGQLDPVCADPGHVATEWADGISIVKESNPPSKVCEDREEARALIAAAHGVYAAGFAFAGPNCRLLGLDKQPTNHIRRMVYCNFDGNRGIKESAARYGSHVEEVPGEWSRPLSVTDFIRAGYLGEPPS